MTAPNHPSDDEVIAEVALAELEHRVRLELDAFLVGVPESGVRVTALICDYVRVLRERGTPIEQVVVQCKRVIFGHAPWEPFRDPTRRDKLAAPIITACIKAYYAET